MNEDVFQQENMERQRQREIDEMYENFKNGISNVNVMHEREFAKYEILYSSELKTKYLNHQLSAEETDRITDLSQELYQRINPQEPLHIIDNTGREVCPPLPPIFRHLNSLDRVREGTNAIDIFHNAFSVDETSGVVAENRKKAAAVNLNNMYINQQSKSDIIKDMKQFDEMSEMFHREVLHNDPYTKQSITSKETPKITSNPDSDDDVEWE